MELNNSNFGHQKNKCSEIIFSNKNFNNPIAASLIFSGCVSAILIFVSSIFIKESMSSMWFSPSLGDILFSELGLKAFFVLFLISEALLALLAGLLLGVNSIFKQSNSSYLDFLNLTLNAFILPTILTAASVIGAFISPVVTAILTTIATFLLVIKLYEGSKELLNLPNDRLIFIVPVCIVLNYAVVALLSYNVAKSYIESYIGNLFGNFFY